MQRLRAVAARAFVLPLWACVCLALPAGAWLTHTFVFALEETISSYASFAFSAYALAVCCASAPGIVRRIRTGAFARRIAGAACVQRLRADPVLREQLSLHIGLLVNILYALIKMVSGVLFRSEWFGALALYYLLLAAMRFALVRIGLRGTDERAQWHTYRICGGILLLMNQALVVVTGHVVVRAENFVYPGVLVYAIAAYTFYAVITAAHQFRKARRCAGPVRTAAKTISLVAALVSLLSLETALLAQFGDPAQELFRRYMTAATGAAVCAVVLAMALYMLVHGTRQLRSMR